MSNAKKMDRIERDKLEADKRFCDRAEKLMARQQAERDRHKTTEKERLKAGVQAVEKIAKDAAARTESNTVTERVLARSFILNKRAETCRQLLNEYTAVQREIKKPTRAAAQAALEKAVKAKVPSLLKLLPGIDEAHARRLIYRFGPVEAERIAERDTMSAHLSLCKRKNGVVQDLYSLLDLTSREVFGTDLGSSWNKIFEKGAA